MLESPPKLKIALLLNSFLQPTWRARIIEKIRDSRFGEISLVVIIDCGQNGAPRLSKFGLNASGLLWKAYSVLDDRTMQPYPDPFEPADMRATLETSATVTVQPIAKGLDYYLADQEVSAIRSVLY